MALGLALETHTVRHSVLERRPRTVCVACTVVCDKTRSRGLVSAQNGAISGRRRFDRLANTRTRNR